MKRLPTLGGNTGIANRFKAQVIERRAGHPDEGKVVYETDFAPNLILENGMNKVASQVMCSLFPYCAIGSGTTTTSDSSGSITATTSGTTCTASSAFFASGDVGKLLRFNTGEKAVITAYTDSTHVTLGATLGVTATQFTMYRIAQTGLDTEIKRTNNYLTGAGNCGSTLSSNVWTHVRTYDFTVEVGTVTYNEVGFSDNASAGANLNMRGLFAGAPITVVAGQQLRVIYNVVVTFTPISPRARSVVISGWPSLQHPVVVDPTTDALTLVAHGFAANTQIQLIGSVVPGGLAFNTVYYVVSVDADHFKLAATSGGSAIDITSSGTSVILLTNTNGSEQVISASYSSVDTFGGTNNGGVSEPSTSKFMNLVTDSTAIPAFPVGSPGSLAGPTNSVKALSKDSYSSGSYIVTWRATYATTDGNSSLIRKFYTSSSSSNSSTAVTDGLMYLFDQAQEKTNLFTLTVVWQYSWDRDFS